MSFSRCPIGKLLWKGLETGYAVSYQAQVCLPQRAVVFEVDSWDNDKIHWRQPSSFLGPVWKYHSWKLWLLLPKLQRSQVEREPAPIREIESSHSVSLPALVQPSLHLAFPQPLESTLQNTPSFLALAVLLFTHRTYCVRLGTAS